mmetsp:Transcript_22944/g.90981  ORF Transcript_22944/g.90981 Transcript_22944/m.90981 type:complete len:396 (-) Transcript_22944:895-2082(-)
MYASASCSASSASKSPTTTTSTLSGRNSVMTARSTSSSVRSGSGATERNRSSPSSSVLSSASCAAPSIDLSEVSCCCARPNRARSSASASQTKAPGSRILCAICRAASKPPQPPERGGGVGNWKSTKSASSVHVTSTMMSRSTQKSSTCSRVHGAKAPPSCNVRAPSMTAPDLMPGRIPSIDRPPAAVRRIAPRCASFASDLTTTRAPFPSVLARAPTRAALRAPGDKCFSSSVTDADIRCAVAASAAISASSMSALGTTSSGSGAIGSAAAAATTARSSALSMSTGWPFDSVVGAHATIADGVVVSVVGAARSTTWAQRSAATRFTSSSVIESIAASVAACAAAGSMNTWSHASVSIRCVTWSACASWSPIAASCSESVTRACENRSSSDMVMP